MTVYRFMRLDRNKSCTFIDKYSINTNTHINITFTLKCIQNILLLKLTFHQYLKLELNGYLSTVDRHFVHTHTHTVHIYFDFNFVVYRWLNLWNRQLTALIYNLQHFSDFWYRQNVNYVRFVICVVTKPHYFFKYTHDSFYAVRSMFDYYLVDI